MRDLSDAIHDVIMDINTRNGKGIVRDSKMAISLAELVIQNSAYEGNWEEQLPFLAEKVEDVWKVTGAFNRDLGQIGRGPWQICIQSKDMKVVSIGTITNYDPITSTLKS